MRLLLIALVLSAMPASALEKDLGGNAEGITCIPRSIHPTVSVPFVHAEKDYTGPQGPINERMLQSRTLRVARAWAALEEELVANCVDYPGSFALARSGGGILKAVDDARLKAEEAWDTLNASFRIEYRPMRLDELEALLKGRESVPGPFAGTCRPVDVAAELFEPAAGQARDKAEQEAFDRLTREARKLKAHVEGASAAFADALRALEGEQCTELNRRFDGHMHMARWYFLNHRSQTLGELWSRKLKWTPVPAPTP